MLGTVIPDAGNRIWKEIISGESIISFEFLAANILTARIRHLYLCEPSKANLHRLASQLRELFVRNSELPSVKKDICKISNMVN